MVPFSAKQQYKKKKDICMKIFSSFLLPWTNNNNIQQKG